MDFFHLNFFYEIQTNSVSLIQIEQIYSNIYLF